MIDWVYYPRSRQASPCALDVVEAFNAAFDEIDSSRYDRKSNDVLAIVARGLRERGFRVETGKTAQEKVTVPVLFGNKGRVEKAFDADAWNENTGFVLEIEAGTAVSNYAFLKDLFQACMMVGVRELGIAVRKEYKKNKNFHTVARFFDTLHASSRLKLPLDGILIVGY